MDREHDESRTLMFFKVMLTTRYFWIMVFGLLGALSIYWLYVRLGLITP